MIDLINNDLQNSIYGSNNKDKNTSNKQASNKPANADIVVTVAQDIIPFPPPYQLVPCKAVCVDVAASFVQFRKNELTITKGEAATSTKKSTDNARSTQNKDDVVGK